MLKYAFENYSNRKKQNIFLCIKPSFDATKTTLMVGIIIDFYLTLQSQIIPSISSPSYDKQNVMIDKYHLNLAVFKISNLFILKLQLISMLIGKL